MGHLPVTPARLYANEKLKLPFTFYSPVNTTPERITDRPTISRTAAYISTDLQIVSYSKFYSSFSVYYFGDASIE